MAAMAAGRIAATVAAATAALAQGRKASLLLRTATRRLSQQPVQYAAADRDPAPVFFADDVRSHLRSLTRIDLGKVYRNRKLGEDELEAPTYRFMTEDELQQALREATEKVDELLQMPPVVKVRRPVDRVLSRDPAVQGYDASPYVFTDITYGKTERERVVVVRDTDGTLAEASWDTKHRMCQLYFPQPGRELRVPLMFDGDYLESLLKRKEYEFLLDRACVQFEPDDPDYQRVTSLAYQYLNDNNDFEKLRSTRHFGPLAFFLAWFNSIDNLLIDLIQSCHIAEANSLILLYNRVREIATEKPDSETDLKLIQDYVHKHSLKKGQLELALQSCREYLKERQMLEEGVQKAHGRL